MTRDRKSADFKLLALFVAGIGATGCALSEDARLQVIVGDEEWRYDGPRDGINHLFFERDGTFTLAIQAGHNVGMTDGAEYVETDFELRELRESRLAIAGHLDAAGVFAAGMGHAPEIAYVTLRYECEGLCGPVRPAGPQHLSGFLRIDSFSEDSITGWIDITADAVASFPAPEVLPGRMTGPFAAPTYPRR